MSLFLAFGGCVTLFTTPVSAVDLTLTMPSDTIAIDLSPSSGQNFKESTSQTIYAQTGSAFGYNLTIRAQDDNVLKNGQAVINPIAQAFSLEQFRTSAPANTWGFKPSKKDGASNSNYIAGPTKEEMTIEKTSEINAMPNAYDFSIAAKVDANLSKGAYKNTFIITLSANTVSYNITYHLNEGQWAGKSPQTDTTPEETVKLDANSPTRDGFEFKGWCSVSTTNDSCPSSGKTYQPGGSYTLTNGSNNLELWAMWEGCTMLTNIGDTGTFTDPRDGTTYKIAKLADGKCWMTENLRIMNKTISSADSDMTSGSFTIPASNLSAFNTNGKSGGWTNYLEDNIAYYGNNTSYGAYYSWYTATAGSGKKSMTTQGQNATDSICPKGWKLPTGGTNTNSDFQLLAKKYTTGAQLVASPANFTYAGVVDVNGSLYAQGSYGYYWSSTVSNNTGAYLLRFYSGGVNPAYYLARPSGYSVRCVAR